MDKGLEVERQALSFFKAHEICEGLTSLLGVQFSFFNHAGQPLWRSTPVPPLPGSCEQARLEVVKKVLAEGKDVLKERGIREKISLYGFPLKTSTGQMLGAGVIHWDPALYEGKRQQALRGLLSSLGQLWAKCSSLEREVNELAEALTSQYEEMSLIYEIAEALKITDQMVQSLDVIINKVTGIIRPVCAFWSGPGDGEGRLFIPERVGFSLKETEQQQIREVCQRIKFLVNQSNGPIILNDLRQYPVLGKAFQGGEFSVLAIPIHSDQKDYGVLHLFKRFPEVFDNYHLKLMDAVISRTMVLLRNAELYENLRQSNLDTMKVLAGALEAKDISTRGHSDRTVRYALAIAVDLGLSEEEKEMIQHAALLHDIGKIGIPEQILNKPGKLTTEEYEIMKRHVTYGVQIIQQVKFLEPMVPIVAGDHERWDGKGYPRGLKEEQIPLGARIVAVVDAYDAMTEDRVYRKAPGQEFAMAELKRCAGTQFDPNIVKVFLDILQKKEKRRTARIL